MEYTGKDIVVIKLVATSAKAEIRVLSGKITKEMPKKIQISVEHKDSMWDDLVITKTKLDFINDEQFINNHNRYFAKAIALKEHQDEVIVKMLAKLANHIDTIRDESVLMYNNSSKLIKEN